MRRRTRRRGGPETTSSAESASGLGQESRCHTREEKIAADSLMKALIRPGLGRFGPSSITSGHLLSHTRLIHDGIKEEFCSLRISRAALQGFHYLSCYK